MTNKLSPSAAPKDLGGSVRELEALRRTIKDLQAQEKAVTRRLIGQMKPLIPAGKDSFEQTFGELVASLRPEEGYNMRILKEELAPESKEATIMFHIQSLQRLAIGDKGVAEVLAKARYRKPEMKLVIARAGGAGSADAGAEASPPADLPLEEARAAAGAGALVGDFV